MQVRDGVDHISKLKPLAGSSLCNRNDGVERYDYFHLEGIIESKYDFDSRDCYPYFENLPNFEDFKEDIVYDTAMFGTFVVNMNNMPEKQFKLYTRERLQESFRERMEKAGGVDEYLKGKRPGLDFWTYAHDNILRKGWRKDSVTTMYVGTKDGIDVKKLREPPTKWQLHILELFNKEFSHLADKHGKIKVVVWW